MNNAAAGLTAAQKPRLNGTTLWLGMYGACLCAHAFISFIFASASGLLLQQTDNNQVIWHQAQNPSLPI